jgi:hypothetical protein
MNNSDTSQLERFESMFGEFTGTMSNMAGAHFPHPSPIAWMFWGQTEPEGWVQSDYDEALKAIRIVASLSLRFWYKHFVLPVFHSRPYEVFVKARSRTINGKHDYYFIEDFLKSEEPKGQSTREPKACCLFGLPFLATTVSRATDNPFTYQGLNRSIAARITAKMLASTGIRRNIRVGFVERLCSIGYSYPTEALTLYLDAVMNYISVGEFAFLSGHEVGHHALSYHLAKSTKNTELVRLHRLLNTYREPEIIALFMRRYGYSREEALKRLIDIESRYRHDVELAADSIGYHLMLDEGVPVDFAFSLLRRSYWIMDSLWQLGCIVPSREKNIGNGNGQPTIAERIERLQALSVENGNLP